MKCQEKNKHYATFEIFYRNYYVNIFPSCRPIPPAISPLFLQPRKSSLTCDSS